MAETVRTVVAYDGKDGWWVCAVTGIDINHFG